MPSRGVWIWRFVLGNRKGPQCLLVLPSYGTVGLLWKLRHGGTGKDLLELECTHRGGVP